MPTQKYGFIAQKKSRGSDGSESASELRFIDNVLWKQQYGF